jgi:hypothetical protein
MPLMDSPEVMGFDPEKERQSEPQEVTLPDGTKETIFYGVQQIINRKKTKFGFGFC